MPMVAERAVLVTGCSSGIGLGTASVLIEHGFRVFGSLRKVQDCEPLLRQLGPRFTPLIFDITDETAVSAAAQQVN